MDNLEPLVRAVPDFPSPGIVFRDITPLLRDPRALATVVRRLAEPYRDARVDVVAAIESRGFILGAPLALELRAGFVPVRKVGKLPAKTIRREYQLEYGSNHLEMHVDALEAGQRVLLVDDVLATGGTAWAALELVRELGGEVVAAAFLIELGALGGRARLTGTPVDSLMRF